jgi:hypothetical protein
MPGFARITDVGVLRDVKAALALFVHEASSGLDEIESSALRYLIELRQDRVAYWQGQVRVRSELLARARSELLRKQVSSVQDHPSVIDERKNLERAKVRLEEAHAKVKACKRWAAELDREFTLFKGACSGLSDALHREMPRATARIEHLARSLDAYAALSSLDVAGVMARPADGSSSSEPSDAPDADELLRQRLRKLRAATPTLEQLDAAPNASTALLSPSPSIPPPAASQGSELAEALGFTSRSPDESVVVQGGCLDGRDAFIAIVPRPSGPPAAYLGDVSDLAGSLGAVRYATDHVVSRRPRIAPALTMPAGYIVLIVAGELEAVINERDECVWTRSEAPWTSSRQASTPEPAESPKGEAPPSAPSGASEPGSRP